MIRKIVVMIGVIWCVSVVASIAAPVTSPNPPKIGQDLPSEPVVANDPLRQLVWDQMLEAGTNSRYWSMLSGSAENHEFYWTTGCVVLAVAAVVVPLIFSGTKKWKLQVYSIINVLALVASLFFLVDTSANSKQLSILEKQWSSLRTQWELLRQQRNDMPTAILQGRVESLLAMRQSIEDSEPGDTNHDKLHAAWANEMRYRGFDKFVDDREKMLKAAKN